MAEELKELTIESILSNNPHITREELEEHTYITRTGKLHLRIFNNRPQEALLPGLMDSKESRGMFKRLTGKYSNIVGKRRDYKTTNTFIDALLDKCPGFDKDLSIDIEL